MKRLAPTAAFAALLLVTNISAYVFLSTPPIKWGGGSPPSPSGGDVNYLFNDLGTPDFAGGPATDDGETALLTAAMNDWEVATAGALDLQYTGTTSALASTGDGANVIAWVEGSSLGSGVLAVATISNVGLAIDEGDIRFNGFDFGWSDASLIRKVALHEVGHTIGLGHQPGSGTAIMNPAVSGLTDLQPDDIAGIVALYGTGSGGDGVVPGPGPGPAPGPEPAPMPRPDLGSAPPTGGGPPPSGGGGGGGGGSSDDDDDGAAVVVDDDDEDYGGGLKGNYRKYKDKYCVVATAAFGSHDASRVASLRTLRDRSLRSTETGSRAVTLYERAAAPCARTVKGSEALRAIVRSVLPR